MVTDAIGLDAAAAHATMFSTNDLVAESKYLMGKKMKRTDAIGFTDMGSTDAIGWNAAAVHATMFSDDLVAEPKHLMEKKKRNAAAVHVHLMEEKRRNAAAIHITMVLDHLVVAESKHWKGHWAKTCPCKRD